MRAGDVLEAHGMAYSGGINTPPTTTDPEYEEQPQKDCIYGIRIDNYNPDPESAITYIDDAKGTRAMILKEDGKIDLRGWAHKFPFHSIKPCLVKDGEVVVYLDPDDYEKDTDGNAVNISSTTEGDVMIEFPRVYWKIEQGDQYTYIRISNFKADEDYWHLAHINGLYHEHEKLYIGAYENSEHEDMMYSISGEKAQKRTSFNYASTSCLARNKEDDTHSYTMFGFQALTLIQILYLLASKNRDLVSILGEGGRSSFSEDPSLDFETGLLNQDGMYCAKAGYPIKFCGIEGIFGGREYYLYGVQMAYENISVVGSELIDSSYIKPIYQKSIGYVSTIIGNTATGLLMRDGAGSSNTFWAGYAEGFYKGRVGYMCMGGRNLLNFIFISKNISENDSNNVFNRELMNVSSRLMIYSGKGDKLEIL